MGIACWRPSAAGFPFSWAVRFAGRPATWQLHGTKGLLIHKQNGGATFPRVSRGFGGRGKEMLTRWLTGATEKTIIARGG